MIGVIHYAYGAPKSIDDVATYFSHILILNGKTVPGPMLEKIEASFKKPSSPDFIASSTQRKKRCKHLPSRCLHLVTYRRITCPSANSFAILTAL